MDLKLVPGACSSDRSALYPTPNSWEASPVWSVELSRIELNMAAQVWDQKGESCASIRPELRNRASSQASSSAKPIQDGGKGQEGLRS